MRESDLNLNLLAPCFAGAQPSEQDVRAIGVYACRQFEADLAFVVQLDQSGNAATAALWRETDGEDRAEAARLAQRARVWAAKLGAADLLTGDALGPLPDGAGGQALLFAMRCCGQLTGLLLVGRRHGRWSAGQQDALRAVSHLMAGLVSARGSEETRDLYAVVFQTVMDSIQTNVYVTDPGTDRILFINRAMRESFGVDQPVGQVCWQALRGRDTRCSFCPVDILQRTGELGQVYQWEDTNGPGKRVRRNCDSLIRWFDGSIVHFQQATDVTELRSACTDELSQMMTRRVGREALAETLANARSIRETVTVCLYDINHLKEINDQMGHAAGDRAIAAIAAEMRRTLHDRDYGFRLSGDEFVLVYHAAQAEAGTRIAHALDRLSEAEQRWSFSYGLVELRPEHTMDLDETLLLADQRMYEQKRQYHIACNEQMRRQAPVPVFRKFTYDSELLYDALVQSTDDYLYVCNMKTGVFRYPRAMVEEFDLPDEVIANAAAVWGAKVYEKDRKAFLESNQEITDGRTNTHCVEYRAVNRRGEWVWLRCRGHLEYDVHGKPALFAGFITNLGKKNKIDTTTGLYNKVEFENQITHQLERRPGEPFGVMVLDIDDLCHINDLYDRLFGDEVIRITSQKLRTLLPEGVTLFRLDGDEFGVFAPGWGADEMQRFYRMVHHALGCQQEYDGKRFHCTLSAGCAAYPADAGNYADLIKYTDYALEAAKNQGKERCVAFSKELLEGRTRALQMTELLRASIEHDFEGFSLCCQPIVGAEDRKIRSFEALARWQCEAFGAVSPVEFIPLLEQSGLILPVGKWVFAEAVRMCRKWQTNAPGLRVSINLSYLQVQDTTFFTFMRDTLAQAGLPPAQVTVELTETHFARESKTVRPAFDEIRAMGLCTAMDDFGTGYSSLGLLKEAPADVVKIDKTFIRDICSSNFDATFIRFVVALCHDVGIRVCLEGVETEAVYDRVQSMGLDYIQGYLFGRPLTEAAFDARLRSEE